MNAAGVMLAAPIADGRLDDWTRIIDTNLTGVLRLVRAFTPDLIKAAEAGRTADVVTFAVSRRRELNLRQIIALPTRQA